MGTLQSTQRVRENDRAVTHLQNENGTLQHLRQTPRGEVENERGAVVDAALNGMSVCKASLFCNNHVFCL
eukprot:m.198489 g.198489  ORF g.198489 m.198489 type:complete len:70 (+) comp15294_c0_seq3:10172-10381(+)